jgi:hypothetical protein
MLRYTYIAYIVLNKAFAIYDKTKNRILLDGGPKSCGPRFISPPVGAEYTPVPPTARHDPQYGCMYMVLTLPRRSLRSGGT